MDPVLAAWALVVVTALLVLATYLANRAQAKRADAEVAVLKVQAAALASSAAALSETARATQAVADEMLEARRAAIPMELDVHLEDGAGAGVFNASVWRTGERGIVVLRTEILAGKERLAAAEPTTYGNNYLGGQSGRFYLNEPYDRKGRDLVILRITGVPEDGLEQSREFLFRVLPNGGLERLTGPKPWMIGDGPGSAIA